MPDELTSLVDSVPGWVWVLSNLLWAALAFLIRQHYAVRMERLKHEQQMEIERLKKDHELELDRKKKQYDDKRRHYQNYWLMLDEYSKKLRSSSFLSETWRALNDCAIAFLQSGDDPARQIAAYRDMMESLQQALQVNTDEYLQIRRETQSLRLVADPPLFQLLDDLDTRLQDEFECTSAYLMQMVNFEDYLSNPDRAAEVARQQQALQGRGESISKLYTDIMAEMRRELYEI